MNQTKSVSHGSPQLGTLIAGVAAAIIILAFVVAGEFNLGFTWSLIATALPLVVVVAYGRARATYREYKALGRDAWYDPFIPVNADIKADARYHCILGTVSFCLALAGTGFFYTRGNPWWIASFIIASIVGLMLGPVEDASPGE